MVIEHSILFPSCMKKIRQVTEEFPIFKDAEVHNIERINIERRNKEKLKQFNALLDPNIQVASIRNNRS
jgi:hypothetical protein